MCHVKQENTVEAVYIERSEINNFHKRDVACTAIAMSYELQYVCMHVMNLISSEISENMLTS